MPGEEFEGVEGVEGAEGPEGPEEGELAIDNQDVERGNQVLTAWAERLKAEAESARFLGANGAQTAQAILDGCAWIRSVPGLEAGLRRLATAAPDIFPLECLDDLEPGSLALFAAEGKLRDAMVGISRRRVPEALLSEATTHCAKLMHIYGFEAAGDAARMALHADLQRGRGAADKASDLDRLSIVWVEDKAHLSKNHKFKVADGQRAAKLAGQIRRELAKGLPPEAQAWRSTQARLFSILDRSWFKVAAAVQLIVGEGAPSLPFTLRGQLVAARR